MNFNDLPSGKEVDRYTNWAIITWGFLVVYAGVPIALSKLFPSLSFTFLMVVLGVLSIPVFVCLGIAARHAFKAVALRRAERRDGLVEWGGRFGRFVDYHPYLIVSVVVVAAFVFAVVRTMLQPK